ncbi:Pkinase-domain-containing protein [Ramicandelaber brevisporus]|nr:Pkinase-domain-containing protein [Ramicandelaber brevisporus]
MEYCAAGDLFDVIQSPHGNMLTPLLAESILVQLLAGIQHMHRCGIAHRDLKLDNICLTADYTVKIIDLGSARHLGSPHELLLHPLKRYTTGLCGSDPYLAPEVIGNPQAAYDPFKLDIWSAGIVYVTLVSGNFPWKTAQLADANFFMYLSRGPALIDHWIRPGGGYDRPAGLIKRMLTFNVADRPCIEALMGDPYLLPYIAI